MTEGHPITASWRIQCDRCEDAFYRATECLGERAYRRGTHELPDLLPDDWWFVDGDLVCDECYDKDEWIELHRDLRQNE